jgi:hypothetical protein
MAARLARDLSPQLSQALQACLTAMSYEDPTLVRSHLNTALEALRETTESTIRLLVQWPLQKKDYWKEVSAEIENAPLESYDDLGHSLEALFRQDLEIMKRHLNGPVRLLEAHGYEVEASRDLAQAIEDMEKLRKEVLDDWPWSSQDFPPVDRAMVAESRAAIGRQEGVPIEDVIRRLGGEPHKEG